MFHAENISVAWQVGSRDLSFDVAPIVFFHHPSASSSFLSGTLIIP
jgi:hypothetical protein